jgi:hypothetical protein
MSFKMLLLAISDILNLTAQLSNPEKKSQAIKISNPDILNKIKIRQAEFTKNKNEKLDLAKKELEKKISEIHPRLTENQKNLVEMIIENKSENLYPLLDEDKESQILNHELYHAIYPLIELAASFENEKQEMRQTQIHAKKLACIFKNKQSALSYLIKFAEKQKWKGQVVHDACLFALPKTSPHTQRWIELAGQNDGENLLNKNFCFMISLSTEIERAIEKDQKEKSVLVENVLIELLMQNVFDKYKSILEEKLETEKDKMNKLKTIIGNEIKPLKDFCDRYEAGHVGRNDESKAKYDVYLPKLDKLYAYRACLHLNKVFSQYTIQELDDAYRRMLIQQKPGKAIFTSLGIDNAHYQKFLALDRSQAGKNIPDILIDCGNGFYIRKLNVQNEEDAVIAACLGKLTNCCQSVSGEAGETCAIHGLTSPDSGFYVMFQGDAKKPNKEDKVIAQTWVNRTESNALLFDSIETAKHGDTPVIAKAYQDLAQTLIKDEKYQVPRVQCGAKSGISRDVGRPDAKLIPFPPKNYWGYRDSKEQLLLSDKNLLFKWEVRRLIPDIDAINKELKIWQDDYSLLPPDRLRFTLLWCYVNSENLPEVLFQHEKLNEYIQLQESYISLLEEEEKEVSFLCLLKEYKSSKENRSEAGILSIKYEEDSEEEDSEGKVDASVLSSKYAENPEEDSEGKVDASVLSGKYAENPEEDSEDKVDASVLSSKYAENPEDDSKEEPESLIKATRFKEYAEDSNEETQQQTHHIKQMWLNPWIDINLTTKQSLCTPLHLFLKKGDRETIEILLDRGANLDIQEVYGRTALHEAVLKDNLEMVSLLLNKGAKVDIRQFNSRTALHEAVDRGNLEIVSLLLNKGAQVDIHQDNSRTALHEAVLKGNLKMVNLLIEHKANVCSCPTSVDMYF